MLKKIFFWNYARNTWQWDFLCVLILIFIFLTPKSWFAGSERDEKLQHQSPTSTVVLAAETVGNIDDKLAVERQVRALTGRSDAQVLQVRRVAGTDGKTRAIEVDIR